MDPVSAVITVMLSVTSPRFHGGQLNFEVSKQICSLSDFLWCKYAHNLEGEHQSANWRTDFRLWVDLAVCLAVLRPPYLHREDTALKAVVIHPSFHPRKGRST